MANISGKYTGSYESIVGTSGNDVIDHKGGNDTINGGSGTDSVLFFDSKNNFAVTTVAGTVHVKGLSSASSDYSFDEAILTNVEKIQFSDGSINIGSQSKAMFTSVVSNDNADSSIELTGVASLTTNDFIL